MFNEYRINNVLDRNDYGFIYRFSNLFLIIIIILLYIIFTYKYDSFFLSIGIYKDDYLEIKVDTKDVDFVINNHYLFIDNKKYFYLTKKKSELYIDNNKNYRYLYLDVYDLYKENNQIYQIRIIKDSKLLVKYLSDL